MMAIPNMEMPKECKECQWHLDFYIEDKQVGGLCTITEKGDKENTCPLIDIVTCGECKHWDETIEGHINVGDHLCRRRLRWTMKIDFCSDGERRE